MRSQALWNRVVLGQRPLQPAPGHSGDTATPYQVPGITTARSLSVGPVHSCVVLKDRTLRCFGNNGNGQIGSGDKAAHDGRHTCDHRCPAGVRRTVPHLRRPNGRDTRLLGLQPGERASVRPARDDGLCRSHRHPGDHHGSAGRRRRQLHVRAALRRRRTVRRGRDTGSDRQRNPPPTPPPSST